MRAIGTEGFRIFLSAGEASGDLHGAGLVRAILEKRPDAEISCLGGSLLRAAGANVIVDNRDVAVVGFTEVFRHLGTIRTAWKKIKDVLLREKPDLLVLIDFPDFNFLLGRFARRHGIKVFYYISPQVWAWRSRRVRALRRFVDSMAVVLPFEEEFYRQRGMRVHYVGHPLLDILGEVVSKADARKKYCPDPESGPVVGLLPGSRAGEIGSLLPVLLGAARRIHAAFPRASFLVPLARTVDPARVHEEINRSRGASDFEGPAPGRKVTEGEDGRRSGCPSDPGSSVLCEPTKEFKGFSPRTLPIRVVQGDTYGVMQACDLLLAASGTVTLEAAILQTPMIIVYKLSSLTYHLARQLVRLSHVGLPNLIAGRTIVPELLQDEAREDLVATRAVSLLQNPEALGRQCRELAQIRGMLGEPGVASRVADLVIATAMAPAGPTG